MSQGTQFTNAGGKGNFINWPGVNRKGFRGALSLKKHRYQSLKKIRDQVAAKFRASHIEPGGSKKPNHHANDFNNAERKSSHLAVTKPRAIQRFEDEGGAVNDMDPDDEDTA